MGNYCYIQELTNRNVMLELTKKILHSVSFDQKLFQKELNKALMLLYLEEKSHKEISEILGITETNVATKIGRIKKLLKQKFSQVEKE